MMRLRVECYSGYKGDERPVRFSVGSCEYRIREVVDAWYSPDATYFRVHADDGHVYILRHAQTGLEDLWTLEGFRRG